MEEEGERYVPNVVTHLHLLDNQILGGESEQNRTNDKNIETFMKVVKFVEHAHEQGESCIIIDNSNPK